MAPVSRVPLNNNNNNNNDKDNNEGRRKDNNDEERSGYGVFLGAYQSLKKVLTS
jgi:hypothetical protein